MNEQRLTRAELDAWSSFDREWDEFKDAWIGRGFHLPPMGEASDDPGTSLRSRLHLMLDWRPSDVVRWVREAPGRTPHLVIGYVFARWNEMAADVGLDEGHIIDQDERHRDAESLRSILGRLS